MDATILVADASFLVGELLRRRGRALLEHPELQVLVAEQQWAETERELPRRLDVIVSKGHLTRAQADKLLDGVAGLVESRTIEVVPSDVYAHLEDIARRRVPRDEKDWPTVALSILLDAGILARDEDFFGCGCPTWTFDTLWNEVTGSA